MTFTIGALLILLAFTFICGWVGAMLHGDRQPEQAAEREHRGADTTDIEVNTAPGEMPTWHDTVGGLGRMPVNEHRYPPPPPVDFAAYSDDAPYRWEAPHGTTVGDVARIGEPWPVPDAQRPVEPQADEYPRGDIGRDLDDARDVEGAEEPDEQRAAHARTHRCRSVVEVYEAAGIGVAYTIPVPRRRHRLTAPLDVLATFAATLVESIRTWARDVRDALAPDRSDGWDTDLGHLLLTSDAVEPDHECRGEHCGHETAEDRDDRAVGRHWGEYPTGQWPTLTARAA